LSFETSKSTESQKIQAKLKHSYEIDANKAKVGNFFEESSVIGKNVGDLAKTAKL